MSTVLLLAGCGDDDGSKSSTGYRGTGTGPSGATGTAPAGSTSTTPTSPTQRKPSSKGTSPAPLVLGPKPGTPKLSGKERVIFLNARETCATLGAKRTARKYKVTSRNPVEVARVYATKAFPEPSRRAAFEGCVAGFR